MKYLMLIIFVLGSITMYSQDDSTKVANKDLIKAAETIKKQRDSIVNMKKQLLEFRYQTDMVEQLRLRDSMLIATLFMKTELQDGIVIRYDKIVKNISKSNVWYENKYVWFGGGVALTYLASVIVKNSVGR